jgi:hypothetical protein
LHRIAKQLYGSTEAPADEEDDLRSIIALELFLRYHREDDDGAAPVKATLFWRRWMVISMGTYQHLMMAPEVEGSNIVACLHLLGMIWIPMVLEEEGLPVPFCVDRGLLA